MEASHPSLPAPTPSVNRPPLMSSSVMSSRAKGTGCRKFGEATSVPSRIVVVTVAAAVSVGMAENQGEPRRSPQAMWS